MLIRSRAESTTIKIGAQFVLLDRSQRPMIQGVGSASVSSISTLAMTLGSEA